MAAPPVPLRLPHAGSVQAHAPAAAQDQKRTAGRRTRRATPARAASTASTPSTRAVCHPGSRRAAYSHSSARRPRRPRMPPRHVGRTPGRSLPGGRNAPRDPPPPQRPGNRRSTVRARPCPPRHQHPAPLRPLRQSARGAAQGAGACAHGGEHLGGRRQACGGWHSPSRIGRPRVGARGRRAGLAFGRAPPKSWRRASNARPVPDHRSTGRRPGPRRGSAPRPRQGLAPGPDRERADRASAGLG